MKPKNFSGGHLTRTQKAAGPNEESMRLQHGLSNASLRISELLKGIYSTYFKFMVYISPISGKLGLTNMAPMASKTWVLKQWVARSSLFF